MNREQRRNAYRLYLEEKKRLEKLYGGPKLCIICGKTFTGLGNNPWPLIPESTVEEVDRRCCTDCDKEKVDPARYNLIKQGKMDGFLTISGSELRDFEKDYPNSVIKISRDQDN